MQLPIAVILLLILSALVFPRATKAGCTALLILAGLVLIAIVAVASRSG
jgi:hypothetical protein